MKFIFIIMIILSIANSKEFSLKKGITENNILNSKEWNQLLYYKNGISEVNDKNFFIYWTNSKSFRGVGFYYETLGKIMKIIFR
jgi:hypothetical protein